MIRLTIPSIEEDDIEAVSQVLKTGYLVQGLQVEAFEQAVANYMGVKFAVAVSNCTAALHLALLALDTRPDDLVIVTAYSWPATANVIELCGAQPVFVDIQPDTFNMDPNRLEETLKELMTNTETAPRVRAILPVHTFGQMADLPSIMELAYNYGIPVVEDAACALGATLDGKQAGTWGVMGCFSFHPRKAITTGEGGIITTDDPVLVRSLRALRNHGQDPDATEVDFIMPGFNYRLTEFQAALGTTQITKLDRVITARRKLAANYNHLLKDTSCQLPTVMPKGSSPVYQSYVVLVSKSAASRLVKITKFMLSQGIETAIGTYNIPMTTYFRKRYGYKVGDFPTADSVFSCSLALPLHERLTKTNQSRITTLLDKLLSE